MNQQTPACWLRESDGFKPCDNVPLSDRGFRYGMSVFESILLRDGHPVFLRGHLDRLVQSCQTCDFEFDVRALDHLESLFHENVRDGLARIYVTAGDGAVSSRAEHCRIFVFAESRTPLTREIFDSGYELGVEKDPHRPLFCGLKTANYWANIAALNRAQPKNESLLFNANGELISACMANVFVVLNGEIKTPAPGCGARRGILREWVMQRRKVVECAIGKGELAAADEIFLTSSWIGVMPVASVGERVLPARSVSSMLHEEYELAVAEFCR